MKKNNSLLKAARCVKNFILNGPAFKKQLKQPPIIIGGCGRSGTTLLLSVLSSHPEIYTFEHETHSFFPTPYSRSGYLGARRTARLYYFLDKQIPKSCNRWCEKTPKNVLFFLKILKHFNNNVKIIHIVRDGRDVVLSRHPRAPDAYWVSPERWVKDVSAGLVLKNHPNVHTVKYEDLVLDFEPTINDMCSFLEVETHSHLFNWHEHATMRRSSRVDTAQTQLLMKDSIGKWKKPEYKERVEELLREPRAPEILKELAYLV